MIGELSQSERMPDIYLLSSARIDLSIMGDRFFVLKARSQGVALGCHTGRPSGGSNAAGRCGRVDGLRDESTRFFCEQLQHNRFPLPCACEAPPLLNGPAAFSRYAC